VTSGIPISAMAAANKSFNEGMGVSSRDLVDWPGR